MVEITLALTKRKIRYFVLILRKNVSHLCVGKKIGRGVHKHIY